MRELAFNPIPVIAEFVEQGGGDGTETVRAHFVLGVAHTAQGIEHGDVGDRLHIRPDGQEEVLAGARIRVQFLKNLHGLRGQRHNVHLLHLGAGGGNAPLMLLKVELAPDGGAEFGRAHEDQWSQP